MRCAICSMVLLLMTSCAAYQPSIKQKSVEPGAEVIIGEFGFWKRDCSSRPFTITVKQKPRYGALRYEVGTLLIPESPEFGKAGKCANKLIQSRKIIYIAGPSFTVNDRVSFSVPTGQPFSRKIYDVEIEIKNFFASVLQTNSENLR